MMKSALDSPHLHRKFKGGMTLYFNAGILPGSFLKAVLRNDLTDAILRADVESIQLLPGLVRWLVHDLDQPKMWGSTQKVARHIFNCNRDEAVIKKHGTGYPSDCHCGDPHCEKGDEKK